mmetsp:Transcript_28995/g.78467  ORF Transcript_28995/g.78467 Transcript_28995/m.78467 type:complete len:414 (-) Transcript_28995:171-1412(-)|eukprot:CAMPEP_0172367600 /NCGR_PEP_ID=MMETSP1060-20121228/22579_1 /TAXON_ID=37318 /ORGANISM="Pseudo-nitzschia pungens, Strain cf. cingulata" /LENGTH=413 /DNA_ID=CAMNT_0013091913 /DNA_START=232 /DNA_END=1473 /DNA_ORIENTATION=+
MPSIKRKKKNPTSVVSVAPLYSEDIGLDGLKKKRFFAPNEIHQLPVDDQEQRKRQKRMQRFVEHNQKNSEENESSIDRELKSSRTYTKKPNIKASGNNNQFGGRSTALEKPYMRLTTAPKAEDVRPLPVLRKSLAHVKAHYIQNEDFDFANEQLKSIRQDITVQHLRNDFVLEVYENHSRILLEHGDLNEFNQCQTMIQSLTSPSHSSVDWGDSIENKSIRDRDSNGNASDTKNHLLMQSAEAADEFQAYSLLYDLVQNSWSDLKIHILSTKTRMHIAHSKGDDSIESTKSNRIPPITRGSSVRHALSVVKAIIHDDYLAFFRLYDSAPHMSAYLMDFLVRRVRNVAYARIVAAYRPTISTEGLREALSFRDFEETRQFLKAKGAVFLTDKGGHPPFWIDCKATYAVHLNRAK